MTNEKKLKSMTVEQLAEFFSKLAGCYNCPALKKACFKYKDSCVQAWQDYLLAEAKENVCLHQKVYENTLLCSDPPQRRWICRKCGATGTETIGKYEGDVYDEVRKAFCPGCAPEYGRPG